MVSSCSSCIVSGLWLFLPVWPDSSLGLWVCVRQRTWSWRSAHLHHAAVAEEGEDGAEFTGTHDPVGPAPPHQVEGALSLTLLQPFQLTQSKFFPCHPGKHRIGPCANPEDGASSYCHRCVWSPSRGHDGTNFREKFILEKLKQWHKQLIL